MKTARWTINLEDVEKRRREIELQNQYSEAFLKWKQFYDRIDNSDFQRFGTAPVRNAYWAPVIGKEAYGNVELPLYDAKLLSHLMPKYIAKMFGKKSVPQKNSNTVTFRRYPALSVPPYVSYPEDILTKALLGLLDEIGYKFAQGNAIVNDAWTINLKETKKENLMLDMFLRGFDGKAEELKKAWEKQNMIAVDVSQELAELLKVYKDAAEHLATQEKHRLNSLVSCMKEFIKTYEDRREMERKLAALVQKIEPQKQCEDCDDEDEDEE